MCPGAKEKYSRKTFPIRFPPFKRKKAFEVECFHLLVKKSFLGGMFPPQKLIFANKVEQFSAILVRMTSWVVNTVPEQASGLHLFLCKIHFRWNDST